MVELVNPITPAAPLDVLLVPPDTPQVTPVLAVALPTTPAEQAAMQKSAEAVRELVNVIKV